jgi:hypothetical protein
MVAIKVNPIVRTDSAARIDVTIRRNASGASLASPYVCRAWRLLVSKQRVQNRHGPLDTTLLVREGSAPARHADGRG